MTHASPAGTPASTGPNTSPWMWAVRRLAAVERPDPCPYDGTAEQLAAWRERADERLRRLLGPQPEPVPLVAAVVESVDCGSYRRDRLIYDSEPDMSVPAYLLVPHDRTEPGPAVLAQHGHGAGKAAVCGIAESESDDTPAEPGDDYAHQLALRGYVVLAPDLRTFGERADWNPDNIYGCNYSHMQAAWFGQSLLALDLWDLARGLDLLAEHPLVDADRIGMVGLSQGGTCTLFLAALDARIRAAVVSGYFSSFASAGAVPWNLCGSQVLPGMVGEIEHLDLGALVAPRALLVESGTEDMIFPCTEASARHGELAQVYATLGVPERTELHVFEGEHRWDGATAYDFLERWL